MALSKITLKTAGLSFSLLLCACSAWRVVEPAPASLDLYDPNYEAVESATVADNAAETPASPSDAQAAETKNKLIYYRGRAGALQRLSAENEDRLEGRMLQLNFVNAPASDAARTIIRDALGETVSVADGVSGVITITAPEPVSARDALDALELALAESGLALIETGSGFLLTTLQNAGQSAQTPANRGPIGYATTIAPVRYGVPSEIMRLIEPFLPERLSFSADDNEGVIIIRGPKVDTDQALEAIETFDAPYLTDRVFGLFQLEFADAKTISEEMGSLLNASSSSASGAQIIPLPRLNLLFVSARSQEGFAEARRWVEQLDRPSGGGERRLRYYPVQYTSAEMLAAQLNAAFAGAFDPYGTDVIAERDSGVAARPQRARAPSGGGAVGDEQISIASDKLNNALLIRATDREYAEILGLIRKMDTPAPQILIEATIAEVTLNDDLAYGVRWFFENAESSVSFPAGATPGSVLSPIAPALNYSYFDNNVGAALNTLSSITDVTVLSAPSIMVLNNQTASLQVGDEVPIVTQQAQSVIDSGAPIVSSLQLRETGVILEVKPSVNASDVVVIEVTQEVSDVTPTTTSGIDSPTIQQRRFTSTVSVRDKGTVALGGLIRETYTDTSSGIPVIKDIPLLGLAFKSREITKRRTELIVFLTPHIIRNESDANAAFKRLRREMRNLYRDEQTATN